MRLLRNRTWRRLLDERQEMIARRDEMETKVAEHALQNTMHERTISRLLSLLNEPPTEELARAHQEIIRLNTVFVVGFRDREK